MARASDERQRPAPPSAGDLAILRHLAAGEDPRTGRPLAGPAPWLEPAVRAALAAAVACLEQPRAPARSGLPWSAGELRELVARHRAGEQIVAIATALERTPTAVTARLVQLELIAPPPGFRPRFRLRGGAEPP